MLYRVASAVLAAALLFCVVPAASAFAEDLIPDVVGLQADEAKALLDQAGYPYDLRHDASKPSGLVFGQTPGGLAARPKGTRVTLTVGGAAPAPVPVPEPTPVPVPEPVAPTPVAPAPVEPLPIQPIPTDPPAEDPPAGDTPVEGPPSGALPRNPLDDLGPSPAVDDGTQPTTPRPIPMDPVPSDPTLAPIRTRPDARIDSLPFATPLRRDGPAIPDVVGLTRAAARLKLEIWQVREELTLAVPSLVGTVVEQWPGGERTLAPGEAVTIVIAVAESPSSGHRFVPDVMGKDLTAAGRALERFGFRTEMRKVRTLRPERVGRAVWQQPRRGSLALAGSVVIVHMAVADGALAPRTPPASDDPRPAPVEPTPVPLDPIPLDPRATDPEPRDPVPVAPRPTLPEGPPAGVPSVPPLGGPPAGMPREPAPVVPPTPVEPVPATPLRVDPPPAQPTPGLPAPGVRVSLLQPTLLSPPAGESYPRAFGATFEWTAVKGATGYDWVIEEEQPSGAWRVIDRSTLKGSRHRPDRLKKGRYRWRARASDAAGPGNWSKWFRLYMY